MSTRKQERSKMLQALNSSAVERSEESSFLVSEELGANLTALSALEELSQKIELCLKRQQQVNFISREIAEIVKKSS